MTNSLRRDSPGDHSFSSSPRTAAVPRQLQGGPQTRSISVKDRSNGDGGDGAGMSNVTVSLRKERMAVENEQLVRRWFEEVWNQGRVEAIDELLAEDVILRRGQIAEGWNNFDLLGMLHQVGAIQSAVDLG
jgi:hypothetical protein